MKNLLNYLLAALLLVPSLYSCDDDDDDSKDENVSVKKCNIAVVTGVSNPSGDSGVAYLNWIENLKPQTLSNSNAMNYHYGSPICVENNHLYSIPIMADVDEIDQYTRDGNGGLLKTGSITLPPNSNPSKILELNDDKAYLCFMSRPEIWIINPKTMVKMGVINISSYAVGDNDPNASCMVLEMVYYM